MTERIGVFVAWPYASGDPHLGNAAGALLPPDIFARYHRLRGNQVLVVSGSDSHGTPITVAADKEGIPPEQLFLRYHERIIEACRGLGISFDLYTHTDTENHHQIAQDFFLRLHDKKLIYRETQQQLFCEKEQRFLPDRYVEGKCPICGYDSARGDQCDNCGNLLDAVNLINPRCLNDGTAPVIRETEHFFLDLGAFAERLTDWLKDKDFWRPNVLTFTRNMVRGGLKGRPITRDLEWGIPVPLPGWEHKRIYVWFEAVIGYYSAAVEWAKNNGQPDVWKAWWKDPQAKGYYFIGKDNIPFHTVIWPAVLIGYGGLNLPYDVPANEFLNLEGKQFSKSRGWWISVLDFISRYDPDPLRYYLTRNAPEAQDTDFSWYDFWRRNNDELVATWGNLAHRVLTFTYRNFDRRVPEPGQLDAADKEILSKVESSFEPIGQLLAACHFKAALDEILALAQEANRYLDQKEPWKRISAQRDDAATTLYVALRVIDSLKVLFYPFIPFSSQRLHEYLGYEDSILGEQRVETFAEEKKTHTALVYDLPTAKVSWALSQLPPGQPLREPQPLFAKLEEKIVEEERARLGQVVG